MLDAKRLGKPLLPILAHAAVHAGLMGLVLLGFNGPGAALTGFAIQLSTHFAIDVWKGKMNEWFPVLQDPTNKWHWWVFGIDQQLHIAVIIWMAWLAAGQG